LKNKQDGVLDTNKMMGMSKNIIFVLMYHRHKLLDLMFKVITMVFLQIMTELIVVKSEEDRTVGITNIILKLMKQN
jgi:hypothetical protein